MDQLTIDLKRTVEFIKTHRWTRGGLAKRRRVPKHTTSRVISPFSPEADSFCLLGAAMRANSLRVSAPRLAAIDNAVVAESGRNAEQFNDHVAKDKRYIIRMLNRIIQKRSTRG
jgi:hypothetical protein